MAASHETWIDRGTDALITLSSLCTRWTLQVGNSGLIVCKAGVLIPSIDEAPPLLMRWGCSRFEGWKECWFFQYIWGNSLSWRRGMIHALHMIFSAIWRFVVIIIMIGKWSWLSQPGKKKGIVMTVTIIKVLHCSASQGSNLIICCSCRFLGNSKSFRRLSSQSKRLTGRQWTVF